MSVDAYSEDEAVYEASSLAKANFFGLFPMFIDTSLFKTECITDVAEININTTTPFNIKRKRKFTKGIYKKSIDPKVIGDIMEQVFKDIECEERRDFCSKSLKIIKRYGR